MDFLKAIVLGIVQGITEWLPISSTAHLLIIDELIALSGSDAFKSLFMVEIQLGSIFAVAVLFFKELWPFWKDRKKTADRISLWGKIAIASVPSLIIGLLLDDLMDQYLNKWFVIAAALSLYGILYIILEKKCRLKVKYEKVEDITYSKALSIGAFQALAIIPGTSRSGSTILGGMILGFSRELAAKFSFFMAIPVMAGASLLRLIKHASSVTGTEWMLLLAGTLVSFLVSLAVIRALVSYVRKHDFSVFGIYRVILAVLLVIWFGFCS